MHQAERADHFGIAQLRVEVGDLRRQQQSLVDDGAGGERGNVEEALLGNIGLGDFGLGALADDVELALELVFGHALARGAMKICWM